MANAKVYPFDLYSLALPNFLFCQRFLNFVKKKQQHFFVFTKIKKKLSDIYSLKNSFAKGG